MVPGAERGMKLVEALSGTQVWMRWEENGSVRTAQTPGFAGIPWVELTESP